MIGVHVQNVIAINIYLNKPIKIMEVAFFLRNVLLQLWEKKTQMDREVYVLHHVLKINVNIINKFKKFNIQFYFE